MTLADTDVRLRRRRGALPARSGLSGHPDEGEGGLGRTLLRAVIILAAGLWALLHLASGAAADITDPNQPFRPIEPSYLPVTPAPAGDPAASQEAAPPVPSAAPGSAEAALSEPAPSAAVPTPAPTIAPEPAMRRAPQPVVRATTAQVTPTSALDPEPRPVPQGLVSKAKSFLSELASQCNVAAGQATGGPVVLLLAVLGTAAALDGGRVLRIRRPSDEELPELLYAGDVIAPG